MMRHFTRHFHHFRSSKSSLLTLPHHVAIIGAPLAYGQPLAGVDRGPDILRSKDLGEKLKQDGWVVEDTGDVSFGIIPEVEEKKGDMGFLGGFPNVKFAKAVGAATDKLAQVLAKHSGQGKFCLTLGGDHSIAIGSIAGILQNAPSTGIIWVDAHADLNSPDTSASGNIHGMVLSYLLNLNNTRDMPGFEWMRRVPTLRENRLVYIGLRDVDEPEKVLIRDLGIKTFTMQDLDRWGVGKVMEMALDHVCPRTSAPRPLHLSFDIDSVDPTYAPSTGTRVAGGLSYRESYYLAEAIAETGLLKSMDMVEVNPALGNDVATDGQITADLAVGLIRAALGNTIL